MYSYADCKISSRRHSHSLLSAMRVPSSFVNGSGSLAFAVSEPAAGSSDTLQDAPGSSSTPQFPGPPVVALPVVAVAAPPAPVVAPPTLVVPPSVVVVGAPPTPVGSPPLVVVVFAPVVAVTAA